MSDPVKMCFEVPENCPPDIELLVIWTSALEQYKSEITVDQMQAAATWLQSHIAGIAEA